MFAWGETRHRSTAQYVKLEASKAAIAVSASQMMSRPTLFRLQGIDIGLEVGGGFLELAHSVPGARTVQPANALIFSRVSMTPQI